MAGEMTITYALVDAADGTELVGVHENLPPGVSPADNELGWSMSIAKLATLAEASLGHRQDGVAVALTVTSSPTRTVAPAGPIEHPTPNRPLPSTSRRRSPFNVGASVHQRWARSTFAGSDGVAP